MTNEGEPWNDSYCLHSETERLLRKLVVGPTTFDDVMRSCLYEVDSLLDPKDKAELESEITSGAAEILAFDLTPFSKAIQKLEHARERRQQEVDWADVPMRLQELSRKRAECVLKFALGEGLIERED